jgi:alpha-galactosidase
MNFTIYDRPAAVFVETDHWEKLKHSGSDAWSGRSAAVSSEQTGDSKEIKLFLEAGSAEVKTVRIRWNSPISGPIMLLADHWERGYGDLGWMGLQPERVFPWYVLMNNGKTTNGFGVKTGPSAMCYWQVDTGGVTLTLDVSCGNLGVQLGGRKLEMAVLAERKGQDSESSFEAARQFCQAMCDRPLMSEFPVYGGNNWYYAYGKSTAERILEDSLFISELAGANANRPFMVIDDCWQLGAGVTGNGGPWIGNRDFPDMAGLAEQMKEAGVRPGIWLRPLLTHENMPDSWIRYTKEGHFLDPSVPGVLQYVAEFTSRMNEWGFELIKHDFTTYDIFGGWGFDMKTRVNKLPYTFADRSRTSAEIITDLYRTIATASKDSLIIGCNTIGHLAAGMFEIQRTGDDTSGLSWERTRRMGVNTLAFRMPQHGTFFSHDADCIGITSQIPWELNKQWLDLLAKSGTPLFVSADPGELNTEQVDALKAAFAIAAADRSAAEPLDWLYNQCPASWGTAEGSVAYEWTGNDSLPLTDKENHWWL